MLSFLIQTASFLCFASVSGYIFHKFNYNFFAGFFLGIALQYVFFYIIKTVTDILLSVNNKKLENERIREFSMQGLQVECPCSKKVQDFVPIRLNTANKYKCSECQRLVSVFIDSSTALATEPIIDTDTTKIEQFINNELRK